MTQQHITSELSPEIIEKSQQKIEQIQAEIAKKVVGQQELITSLIIWLFAQGHVLLEWLPGLAKTLTVHSLSDTLHLGFNRIQFTPDLLPSDLVWTEIFNAKNQSFEVKKWPIFNNVILADEINRAPSKVQSALLEAMAEKSVTIWKETFTLESPFIVLATQNPIEQSGTYTLPEAQLDRFMLKVFVSYPDLEEEQLLYKKITQWNTETVSPILQKKDIFEIQEVVKNIFVSDNIYEYVSHLIDASRTPEKYNLKNIWKYLRFWISPRWWIDLIKASKVCALMKGRSFVLPEDIKNIAPMVLSHRLVMSYEAIADEKKETEIIEEILKRVPIV